MAKKIAEVKLMVDNKEAINSTKKYGEEIAKLTEKVAALGDKLSKKETWGPSDTFESINKALKKTQKQLDEALQKQEASMRRIGGIDDFLANVEGASYNALVKNRTVFTNSLRNARRETEEEIKDYEQRAKRLQQIRDEIAKRDIDMRGGMTEGRAREVLAKPEDYSVKQIQEAVSTMTKLNQLQKENSDEWRESNKLIEAGNKHLEDFASRMKQLKMEDAQMKVYDETVSDADLNNLIKYWEAMADGTDKNSPKLAYYNKLLEESRELQQKRMAEQASKVMASPSDYSVNEINEAIEATKKLQAAQQPGSDQWKKYGESIRNAKEILDQFNAEAKEESMKAQLNRPSSLSPDALSEQKKYWQDMINATDALNPKLIEYKNNLKLVTDEERTRAKIAAEGIYSKVNANAWNGTIGDTKQAYEELKKYRNLYEKGLDDKEIAEIDKALAVLTQKTKEAEQGYMSLTEALIQAELASKGQFQGTVEELQKLKKRLEEIRNTEIKIGDKDGLKIVDDALAEVDKKLDEVKNGTLDLDRILKNPRAASFEDLERAAKVLEKQIKRCAENTAEFAAKSEELRKVNKQLDEIKKSFQEQENIILKTAKRLASYVLVYAGFNEIVGWMKQGINANLELSDSMADVQKTTGLAGVELQELGRSLEAMDTRTATSELYNLAAAAGQIGLKSQEDILGFANAANIISVALNELGAEGSASLMKIAQLTGELRENSTEDALLRIGSAINDLTANSAATAGPITDFINRFGGIAAAAKITTYEMAALGAATDASAQSAEVAGTSMNKFVNALLANTQSVAYAADISYKELQGLIDSGKTMDAIVLVLERMQSMSAGAQQGLLKELGSEGARMNQYVSTLVANLDMLKEQLDISRNAYQENTSVQDEYNVKNESAIGILQRMKNQIIDTFVNSGVTETLKDILLFVSGIPAWLERNRVAWAALNAVLFTFITLKVPATLATIGTGLKQLAVMLTGQFIQVWQRAAWQLQSAMIDAGASVATVTARTSGLTGALRILGHVIKTHPIMFVTSILVSVGAAVLTLIDRTDKLAEATADLSKKHQREAQELAAMRDVILGTNSSYEAQTRVLKDLNTVYEKYLGFEVRILDSYAKKAAALDLVNAKLKEQQELEMYNKERETVNQGFAEDSKDSLDNIKEAFVSIPEIGRKRWAEVKDVIDDALRSGELVISGDHYKDQKAVSQFVQTEILKKLGIAQDKLNAKQKMIIRGAVEDVMEYATLYRDTQVQLNRIDEERQGQISVNAKKTLDGYKAVAEAQKQDMAASEAAHKANLEDIKRRGAEEKKTEADINKELEEAENRHQRDMLKQNQEYLKTLAQLRDAEQQDVDIKTKAIVETEDINSLKKGVEGVREALDEDAIKAVENFRKTTSEIKALEEELANDKLETDQKKKLSEEEVHNKTVDLYKLQRKQAEELQIAQRKAASFMVREWTDAYTKVEEKVKETTEAMQGDPYGKKWNLEDWKTFGAGTIKNLGSASIESLTATYKALEDESQTITKDISWFNDTFKELLKKPIESQKEMDKLVYRWAGQVKAELESRNRGTTGNFIWKSVGSGSDKEAKRKAKEEFKAAMSALEAYFNERETLIREKGLKEGKTQVQINQELERLQTEKLNDEIQLRKLLLEEYWQESTFDPKKYKGVISGTDYFKDKNMEYLNELRVQLEKWGVAMEDGMKKQLTDRMVKLSEQALKLREKINKILLQDDFNEQVAQQYLDSLQELGLLFGLTESEIAKTSEKEGERRLAYMREWAKESYNLNAQQLQDKIEQEAAFSKWRIGRTTEDYEALLIQLRKFHDDEEEADRKAAERRKKIFDNSEQGRKLQEKNQQSVNKEENEGEMWDRFKDLDLVSEDTTDQAQIDVYQAKIDASRAYIEQIKLEMQAEIDRARANVLAQQATLQALEMMGVATDEQQGRLKQAQAELDSLLNQQGIIIAGENEKILENQKNAADRYMAIEQRKVQEAKKYTDAIIEFSGQMGEAAFGEVEDRKEAGKQLIKTLLTTLKDWIQVKTTELVMQQLFSDQSTAISGQQVGKELGMTASKTSADIAAGTASATAKEAGSKGFIGLAIGAAIGAALSALLGLALGAINKSKAEVQSISGTGGRLATGMLTYAEGNYPVLGNDGNVYNAKYEGSGMKTGIYRGGAHFGIFSEKKPEAIIDGDTTQRLIMNHPDIWKAIVTLSKNGRLDSGMGMRTFATGNINDLARQAQDMEASATTDNNMQYEMMQEMRALMSANLAIMNKLAIEGVHSNINMYGDDGLYKSMKKAEKYAGRVGYK